MNASGVELSSMMTAAGYQTGGLLTLNAQFPDPTAPGFEDMIKKPYPNIPPGPDKAFFQPIEDLLSPDEFTFFFKYYARKNTKMPNLWTELQNCLHAKQVEFNICVTDTVTDYDIDYHYPPTPPDAPLKVSFLCPLSKVKGVF